MAFFRSQFWGAEFWKAHFWGADQGGGGVGSNQVGGRRHIIRAGEMEAWLSWERAERKRSLLHSAVRRTFHAFADMAEQEVRWMIFQEKTRRREAIRARVAATIVLAEL